MKVLFGAVACLTAAFLATVILLVVAWRKADAISQKISAGAHTTCVVQQKGLPVTTAFVKVIVDAHILAMLPQPPQPQPKLTPAQKKTRDTAAQDLKKNLAIASRLQQFLPKTRHC